jgi:hypothetical protein
VYYASWVFNPGRNGFSKVTGYVDPYGSEPFEYVDMVAEYASSKSCKTSGVCAYDMAIIKLKSVRVTVSPREHFKRDVFILAMLFRLACVLRTPTACTLPHNYTLHLTAPYHTDSMHLITLIACKLSHQQLALYHTYGLLLE